MSAPMVVTFDDREIATFLKQFPRDARNAGLYGLNEAAKIMQAKVYQQMSARFTYRSQKGRTFLERQVKIDFYKAGKAEEVRIHTVGPNVEPTRQLLPKFDTSGGTKREKSGGMLTIPIRARSTASSVVPKRFRLSQLALKPTPGGMLVSETNSRIFADHKNIYRRIGSGRGTRVEVLYTFRRATPVPTPIRWDDAARLALESWPTITAKAIAEKAAHLLAKGRATASQFGGAEGP